MRIYERYVQRLFALNAKGSRLGLRTMERLLDALGNPQKNIPAIHVAGTNGKGSVTTKIARGLELTGQCVGLFTSPHIRTFRERIVVNQVMITEQEVVHILDIIFPLLDTIPATFFEITTALAWLHFLNKRVDVAVMETGLGGRLDATSVCNPKLTVITSISLDHTAILGDSIEAITREKAGILKRAVPVVVGPTVPLSIMYEVAKPLDCPVHEVQGRFSSFEDENRAIAEKALLCMGIHNNDALEALPPCRFEEWELNGKKIILDVAHNPDGICRLFQRLLDKYPDQRYAAVYGACRDKDVQSCLQIFLPYVHAVYFVEAGTERKSLTGELMECTPVEYRNMCSEEDTIEHAMKEAIHSNAAVIVVFGTFFIMADVLRYLGMESAKDSMPLIEKMI